MKKKFEINYRKNREAAVDNRMGDNLPPSYIENFIWINIYTLEGNIIIEPLSLN